MQIKVLADPDAVAGRAAALIAKEARTTMTECGCFVMAVSDGHTSWMMLTYSVLDPARHIQRLVAGQDKAAILLQAAVACVRTTRRSSPL
jgi:6-phosphogluconolactonase/glucosamine-6-phosphate isomerase/deaminase